MIKLQAIFQGTVKTATREVAIRREPSTLKAGET